MEGATRLNRLGDFLRARRALVTAAQAGIPEGGRRRVPGLRREEVAVLAGISADYYRRLERGQDTDPSEQVVRALSRVLHLDDAARHHLAQLARPRPADPATEVDEQVPERLLTLLDALDLPAVIETRAFDVLASNRPALALSPRFAAGQNRLRTLLLDLEERRFRVDWDGAAAEIVASFRSSTAAGDPHPRAVALVEELTEESSRFRELWAQYDVRAVGPGIAHVMHPELGEMRLYRDKLPVENVILVLFYAQDAETQRKLDRLGGRTSARPR